MSMSSDHPARLGGHVSPTGSLACFSCGRDHNQVRWYALLSDSVAARLIRYWPAESRAVVPDEDGYYSVRLCNVCCADHRRYGAKMSRAY